MIIKYVKAWDAVWCVVFDFQRGSFILSRIKRVYINEADLNVSQVKS